MKTKMVCEIGLGTEACEGLFAGTPWWKAHGKVIYHEIKMPEIKERPQELKQAA